MWHKPLPLLQKSTRLHACTRTGPSQGARLHAGLQGDAPREGDAVLRDGAPRQLVPQVVGCDVQRCHLGTGDIRFFRGWLGFLGTSLFLE